MLRDATTHVALVGTSCVGKTTLLRDCASFARTVAEVARDYFNAFPDVTDRFSYATQRRVQAHQLRREIDAHLELDPDERCVVSDRSVLDAVAYVAATGDRAGADLLLDRVRFYLPTYTHLFLLNPDDVPYATDGVRTEPAVDRRRFHDAFPAVLDAAGVPWSTLSGSSTERLAALRLTLDGSGHLPTEVYP